MSFLRKNKKACVFSRRRRTRRRRGDGGHGGGSGGVIGVAVLKTSDNRFHVLNRVWSDETLELSINLIYRTLLIRIIVT